MMMDAFSLISERDGEEHFKCGRLNIPANLYVRTYSKQCGKML